MLKNILYISLSINLCFVCYFFYKFYKINNIKNIDYSEINNQIKYNKARTEIFKFLKNKNRDIIFIGTSLTEGFPLNEMFYNSKVSNRGIAGNTLANMLVRLDEIIISNPKIIVLEAGINDIQENICLDTILFRFEKIIDKFSKNNLDKVLYIQSIFPVKHYSIIKYNLLIVECNKKLQILCKKRHIKFLDFYQSFNDNGMLLDSLTYDGLHFNIAGYKLWTKLISKELHL